MPVWKSWSPPVPTPARPVRGVGRRKPTGIGGVWRRTRETRPRRRPGKSVLRQAGLLLAAGALTWWVVLPGVEWGIDMMGTQWALAHDRTNTDFDRQMLLMRSGATLAGLLLGLGGGVGWAVSGTAPALLTAVSGGVVVLIGLVGLTLGA